MKATHYGECQVCGATQKLPGGTLAAHGYTVRWGFFSGVCRGSHSLPWEQDSSLVASSVEGARAKLADIRAEQAELRKPATGARAWVPKYIPATWTDRRSRYVWTEVDLRPGYVNEEGHVRGVVWTDETGEEHRATTYGYTHKTISDHATELNGKRADAMEREAFQVEEYIAWQNKRLTTWAPRELKPVRGSLAA